MSRGGSGWFTALLLAVIVASGHEALAANREAPAAPPVLLSAAQSTVSGHLEKRGQGANAVIHYWNRPQDTIVWTAAIPSPGRYCVRARYALDPAMMGGVMVVKVGAARLTAPVKSTGAWSTFATFVVGEIIAGKGTATVTLQASSLPAVAKPALPDLMWLSLDELSRSERKRCD
jgi:hypothetical protein